jgi:hypothetical protein
MEVGGNVGCSVAVADGAADAVEVETSVDAAAAVTLGDSEEAVAGTEVADGAAVRFSVSVKLVAVGD